jgi:predicted PurR-regulated permease PerM
MSNDPRNPVMKLSLPDKQVAYRYVAVIAGVTFILIGCLIILKPFIPALLLAGILCLSTWPAFTWLEKKLNYRTDFAAFLMTVMLALGFLVPLIFLGTSLGESFTGLVTRVSAALQSNESFEAPNWLRDVPWAGPHIEEAWQTHMQNREQMGQTLSQYAGPIRTWLLSVGTSIGRGIFDIALGILIAFFFFQKGTVVVNQLRNLIENFGGKKSLHLLQISANTVIGVVYGILGTALVLGALSTIGFWIAHIPGAPFLGLVTFLLGIIPGGPPFLLIPVTIWLFMEGHVAAAIFMAVWSLAIVFLLDMVIRPYLISKGSKMPLLLVLLGVFGGVAAFGFIGLFIGPALLAIASSLTAELSQKTSDLNDLKPEPSATTLIIE